MTQKQVMQEMFEIFDTYLKDNDTEKVKEDYMHLIHQCQWLILDKLHFPTLFSNGYPIRRLYENIHLELEEGGFIHSDEENKKAIRLTQKGYLRILNLN